MTNPVYRVDGERLWRDLEKLATFGAEEAGGGVTRPAWSRGYLDAERWLVAQFEDAGLSVRIDAARNVWGRWEEGKLPAIVAGSHIDSVPSGGAFDGCLGVLGALEAVRALRRGGHRPDRQIWIVAWTEEEGSAFGNALFGSRAFVGELDLEAALERTNAAGETLAQAMGRIRHDSAAPPGLPRLPDGLGDLAAYLELHVEQGPLLERDGVPVGVVTDIVGLRGARLRFTGQANHAGTTPMDARRDAGVGAARGMVEARRLAVDHGVRATAGVVELSPGGTNVIPGRAEFSLDARDREAAALEAYVSALRAACSRIAEEEGLDVAYEQVYDIAPVPMDAELQRLLTDVCAEIDTRCRPMVSGAGHDAMVVAPHVPAGMVFVPSRDGISHAPQEFTSPQDCAKGAEILMHALARLSAGKPKTGGHP
ncbi:MAG: hydantoinase/carbamoylase family amidase [Streptosporangiales bacterium]|nr:hydantoinase/carbamoylase family amidase [Streptosporangiales bacterium]